MAESDKFKRWHKRECARMLGTVEVEPQLEEKVRTYNFRENRVNHHRTEETTYDLKEVLDGKI